MICVVLNCFTQLTVVTAMDVESGPKVPRSEVLSYVLGLARISAKVLQYVRFEQGPRTGGNAEEP